MFGGDVREWQEKAHAHAARGKFQNAVEEYRKVLKVAPHDLVTRQKVADLLSRLGKGPDAIKEYQHVAGAYAVDGFLLKAMAVCKVILQLDPAHTETQKTLAELFAQKQGGGITTTLPASMTAAISKDTHKVAPPPMPSAPLELSEIMDASDLAATPPPVPSETSEEAVIEIQDSAEVVLDTSAVPHIPLFSDLHPSAFVALLEQLTLRPVKAGEVLVEEGTPGTSMFVIVQGAVAVLRTSGGVAKKVAHMGDGAFFGEMALLSSAPRLATVTAEADCIVLELTREKVQDITRRYPQVGNVLEQFHRDRLLQNLLRSSPLFRPLSETERLEVMNHFQTMTVPAGLELLTQGQQGEALFLILRGQCDVFSANTDGKIQQYPVMQEGDVFGEISLLNAMPVSASVKTRTAAVLLSLSSEIFQKLILPHPAVSAQLKELGAQRLERTVLAVPLDAQPG